MTKKRKIGPKPRPGQRRFAVVCKDLRTRIAELEAELAEALKHLRQNQWQLVGNGYIQRCRECRERPHTLECPIGKLIARHPMPTVPPQPGKPS